MSFREEVITKRTLYDLNKARDKAHILVGLVVANTNIDEIIELIKNSKDIKAAKNKLINKKWKLDKNNVNFINLVEDNAIQLKKDLYNFSETQAKAILELRLQKLTALERSDIKKDLEKLILEIKNYLEILNNRKILLNVIKKELKEIKNEPSDRKSQIVDREYEEEDDLNYIQQEDIVITISNNGYIKRSLLTNYRSQKEVVRERLECLQEKKILLKKYTSLILILNY